MHLVGNISMDDTAYKKFVSLSKEQQRKKVFNAMKPVSLDAVEEALKGIPNGDNISKGSTKQIAVYNKDSDTRGGDKIGIEGRGSDTQKG